MDDKERIYQFNKLTPIAIIQNTFKYELVENKIIVTLWSEDNPEKKYFDDIKVRDVKTFDVGSNAKNENSALTILRKESKTELLWNAVVEFTRGKDVGKNLKSVLRYSQIPTLENLSLSEKAKTNTGTQSSNNKILNLQMFGKHSVQAILDNTFKIEKRENGSIYVVIWKQGEEDKTYFDEFPKLNVDILDISMSGKSPEAALKAEKKIPILWHTVYEYKNGGKVGPHAREVFQALWPSSLNNSNLNPNLLDPDAIAFDPDAIGFDPEAYSFYPPQSYDPNTYSGYENYGSYPGYDEYRYYDPNEANYQEEQLYTKNGTHQFYDDSDDIEAYENEILKEIEQMNDQMDDFVSPCEECGRIPTIEGVGFCKDCCYKKM